jgi:hypothetical protein
MDWTRASYHEAGHMAVALRFEREVYYAGLLEGKPMACCFLELGPPVPQACFLFLAGGAAGELLCTTPFDPPYDLEGAKLDREMITARGGEHLETYLDEARSVLETCKKAWAALQSEFLNKLLAVHAENEFNVRFGGGPVRKRTLLTGDRIKQIWDKHKP